MASLCGLNILALTDHNTTDNCPAFFEAAKRYGIIAIAGMELTTSEDIHIVCLFETLDGAMAFDQKVKTLRVPIKNRPDIFGAQQILDGYDNIIGEEENLLINATLISINEVPKYYYEAIIAVEDHRYKEHGAIDIISIGRAIVSNIRAKDFNEGGSTITQQVAKNLYFITEDDVISRKIAEIFAQKQKKNVKML